jgi:16S rRNA (adenine1518-N6/adenine1519-N6)-dimethyltransferase
MAQSFWKIHFVSEACPRDFFPPPKVASRVLRFVRVTESDCPSDPQAYLQFVKQAFSQRRKTLRSNWESYLNQRRPGMWPEVLKTVMSWGFSEKLRAEELSPGQFMDLYKNCYLKK